VMTGVFVQFVREIVMTGVVVQFVREIVMTGVVMQFVSCWDCFRKQFTSSEENGQL